MTVNMGLVTVSGEPGCRVDEAARALAQRLHFELITGTRLRALRAEKGERFEPCAGAERAGDVTLRWGGSANEMVIHLAACEVMSGVDPAVFSAGP